MLSVQVASGRLVVFLFRSQFYTYYTQRMMPYQLLFIVNVRRNFRQWLRFRAVATQLVIRIFHLYI